VLKISIPNCSQHIKSNHIFVGSEDRQFTIGRIPENDIMVNMTEVSRKHCKILFKDDKWYIADGVGKKGSLNGTWSSLSDFRVKRGVCNPIELEDKDQLKISDSL